MEQALLKLAQAVGDAATKAGYNVSSSSDGTVTIVHVGKGTAVLRFAADKPRIEGSWLKNEPRAQPVPLADIAVEFDPLQVDFVGKDIDQYVAQVAGPTRYGPAAPSRLWRRRS